MTSNGPRTPLLKATLFCPACAHQSPYDGDWRVVEHRTQVHYRCPDCRTEILSQPTHRSTRPTDVWRAWSDNLRAWNQLWWGSLTES